MVSSSPCDKPVVPSQTFIVVFEAFDYSLTYDLRTCGAANNSALVPTLSDVFTEKLTIRKELPVSVSHATTTSCFALGDPHYMTFDSMYYDFMVPGEASHWLVGCRLYGCAHLVL